MSYFRSINQAVVESTLNSSLSNLGPSQFFTGQSTSTLGVNAIQVGLKTNRNCTVYVEQSTDNTNWDLSDPYKYYTSVDNFGVTVQAISSYARIRVQNTSDTSTSYFRLSTVLCPIVEAVPRSLDIDGNLKVGVNSIIDNYDFSVENTPQGEIRTVIPVRLVGSQFDSTTLDSNYWIDSTANSASVEVSNAQAILTSGTNSAGSAKLYSVRRARYTSGQALRYRSVLRLGDNGTADNTRIWGVGYGAAMPTVTDGAFFRMDGTKFSVETLKDTTSTKVSTGSFNGYLGSTHSPLVSSADAYEVYWSNSSVWFSISGELLHKVSATLNIWANTLHQYIYMANINAGNTTSVVMNVRSASIYRLGPLLTQPTSKYYPSGTNASLCKSGPGNLHSVIIGAVPTSGAIITFYDGFNTGGTIIAQITATFPGGGNFNATFLDFKGVPFHLGLYVAQTIQVSTLTVIYE